MLLIISFLGFIGLLFFFHAEAVYLDKKRIPVGILTMLCGVVSAALLLHLYSVSGGLDAGREFQQLGVVGLYAILILSVATRMFRCRRKG